jgi:hypothetical protein
VTKISTTYDTLNALVPTLTWNDAATKTKIIRPYAIEETPEHLLRNGWALRDTGADPEQESQEFNKIVERHAFEFVFTREFLRQDDQTAILDAAYKNLKEDMLILRRELRRNTQLGIPDTITEVELGAMSPPTEVQVDRSVFLQIVCPFTIELREDL